MSNKRETSPEAASDQATVNGQDRAADLVKTDRPQTHDESRQTRRLAANHNESRQTR